MAQERLISLIAFPVLRIWPLYRHKIFLKL